MSDNAVEMTQLVMPPDTNQHGTVFGGRVLQWIDIAAAVSAQRHCRMKVVTASIDDMHFVVPIRLADIVVLRASVNYVHRTSMEVGVRVEREVPKTGERHHAATAYLTFVAIDDAGQPLSVPTLALTTDVARRRHAEAEIRRTHRLARRAEILART